MSVFLLSSPLRADRHGVTVPLTSGSALLRPLGQGETEPQRAVFAAMSPASRHARFLAPMPSLTESMWRTLAAVDGRDHVAWLASVEDRPAGIGRYVRVSACTAEIAFEVADAYHGLGLGSVLLDTVTTVAAAAGVRRLQASVLAENRVSQHLLTSIGLSFRTGRGVLEADSPFHLLETPRVDRPAVVSLAFAARRADSGAAPQPA